MNKHRAIVLLSGGMDSATAFYWAAKFHDVVAVVNFYYRQRGGSLEREAARKLFNAVYDECAVAFIEHHLHIHADSALTVYDDTLDPNAKRRELPTTFVPARNLIFIAHAIAIAYELDAGTIIGGFTAMDVDYPDCKAGFLNAAACAASLALGDDINAVKVCSPLLMMTKANIVRSGEDLEVPWELTRSCYTGHELPCLMCNSCLKRVDAFVQAGVRDPLVPATQWARLVSLHKSKWHKEMSG